MSTEAPWTRVPARRRGPCHRAHAPLKETSSSRKLLADHASEGNHRQAAIVKFLSLHGLELLLGRWLEEGEAVVANRGVCVARRRDVDGATRGWQSNNEARIGTQVGAFKVHARACEGARAPLGARAQAPLGLWRCSRATQGPRCDAAHGPQGYPRGSPRTHREVARLGHLRYLLLMTYDL